ncbi:MAG: FAD-dependent oxidoreductase, partial [Pseudomonadota bacterium]|nr:FAD-dependent oxidoreductase [Pseudomonadota bacterium]
MAETLAVIGGGVVGLNVALALQREGFAVTVYDRDEATDAATRGASHRNAGGFAFSDIFPLASPGIRAGAPGWLLDPRGPLAIRPGHALALMPWLWRLWRATRPERYRAGVAGQTALMTRAQAALERQLQAIGGREMISAQGQLQVYEGAASFAASSAEWDLRREHGVAFDLLDSPEQ